MDPTTSPPRRHRPYYVLWVNGSPVAACTCHYWTPLRYDRQLPGRVA